MPLLMTQGSAGVRGYGESLRSGAAAAYIEDVFSTYLYTGDSSSTRNISNGIDLAGKGGLTWIKTRTTPPDPPGGFVHFLFASDLGQSGSFYNYLSSNDTGSTNYGGSYPASTYGGLKTFNSDGFTVAKGSDSSYFCNYTGQKYVSWTFRKQAKFFDVVTYTGDGTAGRTVSHNLGSVPGCIIIKRTNSAANWAVYHRGLTSGANWSLLLNSTVPEFNTDNYWNSTAPTSSVFTLGNSNTVNGNGSTYVAYLFAHDAGGFGAAGTDNVISCGSFTANANTVVNLGYEPQWILFKNSQGTNNWGVVDTMRGLNTTGDVNLLAPNTFDSEGGESSVIKITATGFEWMPSVSGNTYIYIAIRRGPMKTPTSGTSVFVPVAATGATGGVTMTTNFPADLVIDIRRNDVGYRWFFDRLRSTYGTRYIASNDSSAEGSSATQFMKMDSNTTVINNDWASDSGNTVVSYIFRRAPGFFDVVCYTGTGVARTVSHNLGVVPELIITKKRSGAENWLIYNQTIGNTKFLQLQATDSAQTEATYWNNTSPTSSVFSLGTGSTNDNAATYVAYLFATVAGVSKVGSYTGTGTTKQIDCGFTGGARFVLIKRTDSTGDWYVWDSARGIVSGNDPYSLLNTSAAEVTNTDYIDTYAAGFELSSTAPAAINANGGTYIFLAIA